MAVNWGIITNQNERGGDSGNAFADSFDKAQQRVEQRRQFDMTYDLQRQAKDLNEKQFGLQRDQFNRQGEQWNKEYGLRQGADTRQAETHGFDVADRKAKQGEQSLAIFSDLYEAAAQAKTPEERTRLLSSVKRMVPTFDETPWMTDGGWNIGVQRLKKIADQNERKRAAEAAALDKTTSEAGENRAKAGLYDAQAKNADKHWKESPANPGMLYNEKTGETKPMATGGVSAAQAQFNKHYATTEAPKLYPQAAAAYQAANEKASIAGDLKVLAPQIYAGPGAAVQTEVAKVMNKYLGSNYEGVAPTELFHSLAQAYVGQEGQKYKPLSNSDVVFIEKALPTLGKDPESLPHIIGAIETVAKRDMRYRQLEMETLRTGSPPDPVTLIKQVNAEIPSYVESNFGQERAQRQPGAPVSPATPAPQATGAPQPQARVMPQPGQDAPRAPVGTVIPVGRPVPKGATLAWTPQGFVVRGYGDADPMATTADAERTNSQVADYENDQRSMVDPRRLLHNLRKGPGVF